MVKLPSQRQSYFISEGNLDSVNTVCSWVDYGSVKNGYFSMNLMSEK